MGGLLLLFVSGWGGAFGRWRLSFSGRSSVPTSWRGLFLGVSPLVRRLGTGKRVGRDCCFCSTSSTACRRTGQLALPLGTRTRTLSSSGSGCSCAASDGGAEGRAFWTPLMICSSVWGEGPPTCLLA